MEVLKTHVCWSCKRKEERETNKDNDQVAANRGDSLGTAISKTWARGGIPALYQGLIPWVSGSLLGLASSTNTPSQGMD
jgi:hypothetical protein